MVSQVLVKPEDYLGDHPDPVLLKYKDKTPRNVLTFSDGVLEEYSSDEEEKTPSALSPIIVDPNTLTWGPWMLYKTWAAGYTTRSVIDYVGEALASFFDITTPRYYFELEEYKRRKAEKEREAEKAKGWTGENTEVVEVQLTAVNELPSQPNVGVMKNKQ
ncbi:hypothetical protein HUJ04_006038 [Dendroctonus ponderosae]|nr:hypothetical protein HUJ04_006038 [Dendroctonus ponderosae]